MRYNTTLILAVIVLAAAALVYVYRDQLMSEAPPPPKPTAEKALVEGLAMNAVSSVKVEERTADGKTATRLAATMSKDGQWSLTEPLAVRADDYEIGRLLNPIVEAKYRQALEPGAKGQPTLEALGLAAPAWKVTLGTEAKDGKPARTVVVEIGRKPSLGEGLYVRLPETNKVVVLDKAALLDRVREKIETYRGRDLLGLTRDDLVRIDLAGEKGAAQLDKSDKDDGRWVLSKPLAARADPEAAGAVVRALLGAQIKEFVEDKPTDLARFGLDKPRLTVTLFKPAPADEKKPDAGAKADEKPAVKAPVAAVTLAFGGWADLKHETVYLRAGEDKPVVSVAAEMFNALAKAPSDLRDKHVLVLDPARVTQIALDVPAKLTESGQPAKYELIKTDGKWQVKAPGQADAKADPEAVEALLKELEGLKVIYFAEGEFAEAAKGFKAAGSVRIQMEKDAAPVGFEIGGAGDVPTLVKNLREDWVGRINEKSIAGLRKGWLDLLDKQVLSFHAKDATRLSIAAAGRTVVLEKKGEAWAMTAPVAADAAAGFAQDRLADLAALRCLRFTAATKDFKAHKLEPGEVVATVTLKPAKDGEKPVEKVLRLARAEKARILGRVDGSDFVFEAPLAAFQNLTAEPLPQDLVEAQPKNVTGIEIAAGDAKLKLMKVDNLWYKADAKGMPGPEVPTEAAEDIARTVTGLKAVRWADYEAKDPAAFGLDKAALVLTLTADSGKIVLRVSDKAVAPAIADLFDQQPIRYAQIEGGRRIAVIAGPPVEALLGAAQSLDKKPEDKKPEVKMPVPRKVMPRPAAKK